MTVEEYNVKCGLLRTACPMVEPHVLLFESGTWLLLGYRQESAEVEIIKVEHKSFSEAEKMYRSAYARLLMGGMIKPPNVERSEVDA